MSPSGWTLTAVVTFSAVWLLIPLIAAWASYSGRLDRFLAAVGRFLRPVGRRFAPVGAWLMRHPLAGGLLSALAWFAPAGMSVAKGRNGTAVVQVVLGLAYGGMMVLNLRRARRQQETNGQTR